MLASYQEKAAGEWDTNASGRMARFVDPSLPGHQPGLTPIAMLRNEILERCCIRPISQHAFKVCDINPGNPISKLDFFLLFGLSNCNCDHSGNSQVTRVRMGRSMFGSRLAWRMSHLRKMSGSLLLRLSFNSSPSRTLCGCDLRSRLRAHVPWPTLSARCFSRSGAV